MAGRRSRVWWSDARDNGEWRPGASSIQAHEDATNACPGRFAGSSWTTTPLSSPTRIIFSHCSEAERSAVLPKIAWFVDAAWGDDAGDQFGRGDVETGIEAVAGRIGNADVFACAGVVHAPGAEHFRF